MLGSRGLLSRHRCGSQTRERIFVCRDGRGSRYSLFRFPAAENAALAALFRRAALDLLGSEQRGCGALVRAGLPFRDAHRVAGELVLTAIERKCTLEELPFSVYKEASPLFEETIYEEIRPYACAMRRKTAGAPGAAEEAIRDLEHFLSMFKGDDAND